MQLYRVQYTEKIASGFGGTAQGPFIKILSRDAPINLLRGGRKS